jgi:sterol 14-demethylase
VTRRGGGWWRWSWTLIELLRHPDIYAGVINELDERYGDGQSVSFHALRQIPRLENVLKETLRLHPPLIILMRVAKGDFEVGGNLIRDGDMVAASPAISNRSAEAIFSVLLRECEFEMTQTSDSYRNDHSKMVVQLARPARVRYRRRTA